MIPYNKRQDAQIVKIKDYINGKGKYVTGEGTSITLENTVNTPFNNIILKGNTSQNTTTGKNLIKLYKATKPLVVNGLTFTELDDNTLKINGTSTAESWIEVLAKFEYGTVTQTTPLFKLNLDKKYVCLWKNISGTKDKVVGIYLQISKDNVLANGKTELPISISNSDGIYRGSMYIPAGTNLNNYTLQLQLEEGTTSTDFEPYTNGASPNPDYPQEIQSVTGNNKVVVSNQNLFDKDNANILNGYINGTTKTYQELSTAKSCYISIKPNTTYTISKISSQRFGLATFNTEIINGTTATIIGSPKSTDTSYTITTGGNDKYLVVFYYLSTADTLSEETIRNSIQIEQGSTATSYVTHKGTEYEINLGNIELNAIDNYKDYFKKENGKWYKVENIGSYTFEGNENFSFTDVGTINQRFDIKISALNIACLHDPQYKLFTHFRIKFNNDGIWGEYYMTSNWLVIKDNDSKMTSLENFKSWLSTNKPTIYYVRTSAIDIEITDTTLITQLDALEQAVSYDDITNISQTNANLPFIINAEAVKKLL